VTAQPKVVLLGRLPRVVPGRQLANVQILEQQIAAGQAMIAAAPARKQAKLQRDL
jgi:hypothetical protein